jgi:hypothetical protein
MPKAKQKTTENTLSVSSFVKSIEDKQRQKDCFGIIEIIQKQSGFEPKMCGPSIIGFGSYHYKYESGHEGELRSLVSPRENQSWHCTSPTLMGKKNCLKNLENIK